MYEFIALVWDRRDQHAMERARQFASHFRRAAPLWTCRCDLPGMTIFDYPPHYGGLRAYVLANDRGVIFGRLFPTDLLHCNFNVECSIDENAAAAIAATGGAKLIDDYWGNYVAFIADDVSGRNMVIRDCSGKVPCYRTQTAGVEVFFSDIRYTELLPLPPFTINWRYLAAFLCSSQLQVRESGLTEVREVLAGECVRLPSGSDDQHTLWNPAKICRTDVILDRERASREIRNATQLCINAWASVHRRVLHSLSGGFDSAVILGAISRSPIRPQVVCLNRFGMGPGEDERPYARMAALRAGVELLEYPWEIGERLFDERILGGVRLAKPDISHIFNMLDVAFCNEVAARLKIECMWTGQGGDHLFLAAKTDLGVADCFQRRGLSPALSASIGDAHRLTGHSFWHILGSTIAVLRDHERWMSAVGICPRPLFVNPDALPKDIGDYIAHPWTRQFAHVPVGKRYQIHQLAELLNRQRPIIGLQYEDEHHPLLSQPLIDICLRVPVDILLSGGRTRGLAREAFKEYVPEQIIGRESKGQTTTYSLGVFRRSQDFVRELLLDGTLAREGVLARSKLEEVISRDQPTREQHFFPLFACIAGEAWAQSWVAHSAQKRARGVG